MPSCPDAILLCGGVGVRLRSVTGEVPKAMAEIGGRPFLELLLRQLSGHGFRRAVLAVGYRHEVIQLHFGERAFGLDLTYSVESRPLGTGGALRNAAEIVRSESVLVMNGDSYTDADFCELVEGHRDAKADVSVTIVAADGREDCGSVLVDADGRLVSFEERRGVRHAPFMNAGIYAMSRTVLYEIDTGAVLSLEDEILPRWLRQGKYIRGFICAGECIDIGTPERYRNAQDSLAGVARETSVRCSSGRPS